MGTAPKTNLGVFLTENERKNKVKELIDHIYKQIGKAEDGVCFKWHRIYNYKCPFSGIPLTKENAIRIFMTPLDRSIAVHKAG